MTIAYQDADKKDVHNRRPERLPKHWQSRRAGRQKPAPYEITAECGSAGNLLSQKDGQIALCNGVSKMVILAGLGDREKVNLPPVEFYVRKALNELLEQIFNHGADINHTYRGSTALQMATQCNDLAVVRYLLDKGADVNIRSESGDGPLHEASRNLSLTFVNLLLEKGAEVNAQDKSGNTALMEALSTGYVKDAYAPVIKRLLEKGADVNIRNKRDVGALEKAVWGHEPVIVQMLLEKGAEVNAQDKSGNTALMEACERGKISIVELLLEKGADVNIRNKEGKTALMKASDRKTRRVLKTYGVKNPWLIWISRICIRIAI
jgi:ankyrin repeat protein